MLGPVAAGILLATIAPGGAFVFDALTFLVVIAQIVRMRPSPPSDDENEVSWEAIKDGFRFLKGRRTIQSVFLADLNAMVFGFPIALFPAVARQLGGRAVSTELALGLLYAAPAAGAFLATMLSGRAKHVRRQGRAILVAIAVWGAAIVVFGLSDALWLSLAMLAVAGAGDMVSGIFRATILQTAVEDRLRGRLDGIGMAVWATGPSLGNVESGVVASLTTVPFSIVSGGVLTIAGVGAAAVVRAGVLAIRRPRSLTVTVLPTATRRGYRARRIGHTREGCSTVDLLAFNTTLYEAIVFVHIFAAIIWVGGAFFFQVKIAQFKRANDNAGFLALGRDAEHIGMRLFMPMSIVVLLAGITLVWYGPFSFELWIALALAGIVATSLVGAIYLGPTGGQAREARRGEGVRRPWRDRDARPAHPDLAAGLRGAGAHRARHGVQAGSVAPAQWPARSTPRSDDHIA